MDAIIQLQEYLFAPEINTNQIEETLKTIQDSFSWVEANHELLSAICLRYDLIPVVKPYIQKIYMEALLDIDPLFLIKLMENGLLPLEQVREKIPRHYLKKENGEECPCDYEVQRAIHFGGEVALIIFNDDIDQLSSYSLRDSFRINHRINMVNELFDYSTITPISYAAQCGSMKCFKFLLLNGADINIKSKGNKWNPLNYAASNGNIEIVKILWDRGLQINDDITSTAAQFHRNNLLSWFTSFDNIKFEKSLISSSIWNNIEGVKICLEAGANVNFEVSDKLFPIHFAAWNAHLGVIQLLLNAKADLNPQDLNGITPLHFSSIWGTAHITSLLLKAGADQDIRDEEGKTPLEYAIEKKRDHIVQIFEDFNNE